MLLRLQDKVWVSDPDGAPWEYYTVLADAEKMEKADAAACCTSTPSAQACC